MVVAFAPTWSSSPIPFIGAAGIVLAAVTYLVAPRRSLNRMLAVFLFFEGMNFLSGGMPNAPFPNQVLVGWSAIEWVTGFMLPWLYLMLLGFVLDTKLTRPLQGLWVRISLVALAVVGLLLGLATFDAGRPYSAYLIRTGFQSITSTYGLVAALLAFMASKPQSGQRKRFMFYLVAFGARDVGWGFLNVIDVGLTFAHRNTPDAFAWLLLGWALSGTVFLVGLVYGVLQAQLFDIDLKIKFAIKGSTLGAVFVVAFLIVSQLVQNLTTSALGVVAGAVVAGVLLFALRPLERMAGRVADAAMPKTKDTAEYAKFRKMEVYKATMESFLVDGKLSERESAALKRLQEKLAIPPAAARALERDAARSAAKAH